MYISKEYLNLQILILGFSLVSLPLQPQTKKSFILELVQELISICICCWFVLLCCWWFVYWLGFIVLVLLAVGWLVVIVLCNGFDLIIVFSYQFIF
jgi:hypothetical protein